jgi:glycosyltransferase involved in cell wall biosynthesis
MKPKLSIIITCYNLGLFLKEAVTSIINYPDKDAIEIIIINDGSTEPSTIEAIRKIEANYPELIVVNQNNQGLGNARNNGIAMAKGAYIIPLDADNKLRHEFIITAIKILDEQQDIDIVHGNAEFFGEKTGIWKAAPFNISEMVLNNYIDACACFRKSVWEELGGYDTQMPIMGFEDWDLWLRMGVHGCNFEYINTVFFDYRVRESSMIKHAWENRQELVDYMFSKQELRYLLPLRNCLIENKLLKEEPAFKEIFKILKNKARRRFKF